MSNRRLYSVADVLARLYLVILVLLPFQALLTTWVGSAVGRLDAWRIWKEVLIFASSVVVVWLLVAQRDVRRWAFRGWLAWLVLAYVGWGITGGLVALATGRVSGDALVYGIFADLRFPAFMMLVAVVARTSPMLNCQWRRAIIGALTVVVAFGLMQLVLPADFLRHFGYSPDTIPAVQYVDNKPEYPRLQATLRGPNPLGAYLVLGIAATLSIGIASKRKRYGLIVLGSVVVLAFTYSRSAYLGACIAVAVAVWLLAARGHWQKRFIIIAAVAAVVGAAAVVALRNNDTVQNIAFHSDEHSMSAESSNTGRARSLASGMDEVLHKPLGQGIGTAGPASMRNTKQPARIAENYYIQVGQEMGWVGVGLFMAIQAVLLARLWPLRAAPLGAALLASWCGLLLVNMLSHAWADDTLGLLWWGLAGIALGSTILDNQNGKHKQAKNIQHDAS